MSDYRQYSDAKPHLSTEHPTASGGFPVDKDAEAYCTVCGARVTVGPEQDEFGHFGDCTHHVHGGHAASTSTNLRVPCPTCGRGYQTTQAMRAHHTQVHGEKLRDTTECKGCGETIAYSGREPVYCSNECKYAHLSRRVTLTCERCGDEYTRERTKADERSKYCGQDCHIEALKRREERTCPVCGDDFETTPAQDKTYCTRACYFDSFDDEDSASAD